MKKMLLLSTVIVSLVVALLNCSLLDVVARDAKKSFALLLENTTSNKNTAEKRWELLAPGNETFSMAADLGTTEPDITRTFSAAPFLRAGLDIAKLPADFFYDNASGILTLRNEISNTKFPAIAANSFSGLFSEFLKTNRSIVGYHEALDHYGIKLGNGNMLEWAKDPANNDKDLVFVLNPAPFLAAGLDTGRLTDWIYAEVPMKKMTKAILLKFLNF